MYPCPTTTTIKTWIVQTDKYPSFSEYSLFLDGIYRYISTLFQLQSRAIGSDIDPSYSNCNQEMDGKDRYISVLYSYFSLELDGKDRYIFVLLQLEQNWRVYSGIIRPTPTSVQNSMVMRCKYPSYSNQRVGPEGI